MYRMSAFVGMAIMGMAFVVGTGTSQDAKKNTGKTKAYLPPGWKALNVSKEQALEISKLHATYKGKIQALEAQITAMKTEEKQEMVKLLTEDQKDKLRKLVIPEDAPKDTKIEPKKDGK